MKMHDGFQTVYQDRVVPMQQLRQITEDHYKVRASVLIASGANDVSVVKDEAAKIEKLVAEARSAWGDYAATNKTDQEMALVDRRNRRSPATTTCAHKYWQKLAAV